MDIQIPFVKRIIIDFLMAVEKIEMEISLANA